MNPEHIYALAEFTTRCKSRHNRLAGVAAGRGTSSSVSEALRGSIAVNVIQFADENIRLNEKGKPWSLAKYQRDVLTPAYARHYSIRLWSEVKKSGKTSLITLLCALYFHSRII